ncbi:MAG: hypothetical protein IJW98_02470 [Clostridia bacterium]|nr:hypothetical protein [Clostridia bacterium]
MKAKFLTKAGRVGYFILFLLLIAAEVGSVYIVLTDFSEETSVFAVAAVIWLIPALLSLLTVIFSSGAELTLERGKLTGRWRGREFSSPLSDVQMLYCNTSKKGGDYLYLRTGQGSYHFWGMRNAEEMRDAIAAALPLPADCANLSDSMLEDRKKAKKKIYVGWSLSVVAMGALLIGAGIVGVICLRRHLPIYLSVGAFILVMIMAMALSVVSGKSSWHHFQWERLQKEINRRKIGNIDDYPEGYTDVVKVIYYWDYEERVIICHTDDGYTLTEEFWEDDVDSPKWVKDEDYAQVHDPDGDDLDEDEEEDDDDPDEDETPRHFATIEALEEHLKEEYAILGFDETVYFD